MMLASTVCTLPFPNMAILAEKDKPSSVVSLSFSLELKPKNTRVKLQPFQSLLLSIIQAITW